MDAYISPDMALILLLNNNKKGYYHFMGTYYIPDPILGPFHVFSQLVIL